MGDTMAEMKTNKKLKDVIIEYLPQFNNSVKTCLTKNLKTLGDDRIVGKINIHMAFYSEEDKQGIREPFVPFAIRYTDKGQAEEVKVNICEDIKKEEWWKERAGLIKESKLQIFSKSILNSLIDNPSKVWMVLVIELREQQYQREIYLTEVIIDILRENITDVKDLKDSGWSKRMARSNTISLMERYQTKVFQKWEKYPMLSMEKCCCLSYERNEGRECLGRIYLGQEKESQNQKKVEKENGIVCFENTWNDMKKDGLEARDLENGKIRYIRKMVELCKDGKYLLTWFDKVENRSVDRGKNDLVDLFGIVDQEWLEQNRYTRYISFEGYGEWNLNEQGEMLLLYTKGNYYFSKQSREKTWEKELQDKEIVEEEFLEKFKKIIEKLSEQEHGTSMIILEEDDIKEEVKRLCKECGRGTQIHGVLNLEKEGLDFLKGLTSLDGALLVDKSGNCHAFGVILDGEAKKQGNPAKGARHNSALTYINAKPGRSAVVVSEDKTILIKKSEA